MGWADTVMEVDSEGEEMAAYVEVANAEAMTDVAMAVA